MDGTIWPHLTDALHRLRPRIVPGARICVTGPTGSGKTTIQTALLEDEGVRAVLYTNRNMLRAQTARVLDKVGIEYGVRAAGSEPNWGAAIQLSSIQTEDSWARRRASWRVHNANRVLIDEAHQNAGDTTLRLINDHMEAGAALIGFTATPLDIGHVYNELIVAGETRQLIDCGVLVKAMHFAPDEPDCKGLKRQPSGEYSYGQVVKTIMSHSIIGRVVENYRILNPEQLPTILFAPGVAESLWFAQMLTSHGIPAAHIDGTDCWWDGETYKSDDAAREELRDRCESGDIKVVCNRYVMREGIDWPFLCHGIFATIFGSLKGYLQSGGRLLRSHPGKDKCTIQDHGGNWWRHGSLNETRYWALKLTDYAVCQAREDRMRNGKERQPIRCPRCGAIRMGNDSCYACGYRHTKSSRMVVQKSGTLKEVEGEVFKPRKVLEAPREKMEKSWLECWGRIRNMKDDNGNPAPGTYAQARGLFVQENFWQWPPNDLKLMPIEEIDWYERIGDVHPSRLHNGAV